MYSEMAAAYDLTIEFHHWLPACFHGLEASNESWKEICCVSNLGLACVYVWFTCSPILELMLIMSRTSMAVVICIPLLRYAGDQTFVN